MQKAPFNLDREFIKWFYEEPYPQLGSNRSQVHVESLQFTPNTETRDYWMRLAYKQGAETMANETLQILGDWAAACSGLDPELTCPDEVFDRAQENLDLYFTQLELFK